MEPLIVANWKMNPQKIDEARKILKGIKEGIGDIKGVEIIICPPFVYLPYWVEFFKKDEKKIKLGAQDCFWQEKGAFTGEVSPKMLKDLGVEYVILGHSERRKYFGETDEMINKKLKAAISAKLKPILCVGETERELGIRNYELGEVKNVLRNQLKMALKNIPNSLFQIPNSLIIAYEPVWAIGTGNPCPPEEAKKVLLFLRKILKKNQILYGGSVNSENAIYYIKEANFDGLLVGGASLKAKEFIKIVKSCSVKN